MRDLDNNATDTHILERLRKRCSSRGCVPRVALQLQDIQDVYLCCLPSSPSLESCQETVEPIGCNRIVRERQIFERRKPSGPPQLHSMPQHIGSFIANSIVLKSHKVRTAGAFASSN